MGVPAEGAKNTIEVRPINPVQNTVRQKLLVGYLLSKSLNRDRDRMLSIVRIFLLVPISDD